MADPPLSIVEFADSPNPLLGPVPSEVMKSESIGMSKQLIRGGPMGWRHRGLCSNHYPSLPPLTHHRCAPISVFVTLANRIPVRCTAAKGERFVFLGNGQSELGGVVATAGPSKKRYGWTDWLL
jgi:hypothetical protein